MEADKNIVDLTFLKKITLGNTDKMKYYIEMHLETSPGLFSQMYDSFETLNYDEIFSKAHSLKPQCDYIGIVGLKEMLTEIENAAREKRNTEDIFELVQRAIELNNNGMTELKRFLDQQ